MKKVFLFFPILVSSFILSAQTVTFSIQGHQDDWQLFMSKQIVADIKTGGKVVFITFTAGDGGNANRAYGPATTPYFMAREMGSVYSSKWAVDLLRAVPDSIPAATTAVVNGHNITKYVYKNAVNYFLRLPDGFQNGTGDPGSGNVSMQQLREGKISSLYAIDTSTFYVGWTDLVNTVKTIILAERNVGAQAWINVPSLDTVSYNLNDHSDHRTSSHAAQEAVATYAWMGVRSWKNYESKNNAINLTTSQHQIESILFGLCTWGEVERKYTSDFEPAHQSWLNRDVSVVTRNPSGTARMATAVNEATTPITAIAEPSTKIYMTNPISGDEKIVLFMTLPETGVLTTSIYAVSGNLLYSQVTKVKAKERKDIQLNNPKLTSGMHVIKNVLNGKLIESTKLLVD